VAECPLTVDGAERHLTELLSDGFTVLSNSAGLSASLIEGCRAVEGRGQPVCLIAIAPDAPYRPQGPPGVAVNASVCDAKGRFAALYDAAEPAVYLFRPDGHVAARWRTLRKGDLAEAIDTALARALPKQCEPKVA
jgi:3-(3-hydroxy-phenyl)propionate hydroxylase